MGCEKVIKSNYVSVPVYRVVSIIKYLEGLNHAASLVCIKGKCQGRDPQIDETIDVLKKLIRYDDP
jgi:hypothetical protein